VAALAMLAACGEDDDTPLPFETTVADCGSSLAVLTTAGDAEPSYEATYSEALSEWSFPNAGCGLGVLTGRCADGKRLLYRNGGFVSEIRYYDGEQLVGYVGSGDVGFCPSVCPFSHFYGELADVRCDAPTFDDLCEEQSIVLGPDLWMPFADGQAPGGCAPP
jgi:hypothetical protein